MLNKNKIKNKVIETQNLWLYLIAEQIQAQRIMRKNVCKNNKNILTLPKEKCIILKEKINAKTKEWRKNARYIKRTKRQTI